MTLFTGLAVYIIIWWMIFFMVLPIGARNKISDADVAEGQFPGAPAKPMMKMKVLLCSGISAVLYGIFHWAWESGYLAIIPATPQ